MGTKNKGNRRKSKWKSSQYFFALLQANCDDINTRKTHNKIMINVLVTNDLSKSQGVYINQVEELETENSVRNWTRAIAKQIINWAAI